MFDRIPSAVVASALEQRPAYRMLALMAELFQPMRVVLKKRTAFFSDGGEESRAAFVAFRSVHEAAMQAVSAEENGRKQFAIPETLFEEQQRYEAEWRNLQEQFQLLRVRLDEEKTELVMTQSQLEEDLEMSMLERAGDQGEQIVDTNLKMNDLNLQLDVLLGTERRLKRETNPKCCPCIITQKRQEKLDALEETQQQINRLNRQMKEAAAAKPEDKRAAEIQEKKAQLKKVRSAIKSHDLSRGDKLRSFRKHANRAGNLLQQKQAAIKKSEEMYYGRMSPAVMHQLLLVVLRFYEAQEKLEPYLAKIKAEGKNVEVIDAALHKLQVVKDRTDEVIEMLHCDEFKHQTIKMILDNPATKTAALSSFEALKSAFEIKTLSFS